MSDRLPLFCAAALAIAVAWLGTMFHVRGIAIAASIVAVLAVVGAVAAPTREQRKRGAVFTIGSACLGDNDFCPSGPNIETITPHRGSND